MEVYLIRHGIAAERGTYTDDEQRPLVPKGIDKTTKVARSLVAKKISFDLILTSPLTRAYQTAEIMREVGLCQTVRTFAPLKPEGDIREWLTWLQTEENRQKYSSLALVGHQPNLGDWAEMLIWGTVKNQIVVKKAGIVGLILPDTDTPISRSTLFLLSSPKWII
ncbi:MAG: phosphohistidine phosphatase SixA [Cyanobacteria bacterium P01_G01_bin.19]